ncbi:thioredoxin domain-containing protein [Candidatus Woesearchaeota archaeon]|nr:thioredoxin domain-containing protein [Candidatus Woesearchaeota archaeon]
MVFCIIGLVVFGLLGIFSAKYRGLASESFNCVFRMATFRKCESTFDQRARAHSTALALRVSPLMAKIVFRHFTLLSWMLVIFFISSSFAIGLGVFNYVSYGNCNGPDSSGFCPFSQIPGARSISVTEVSLDGSPVRGNASAPVNIIEFACLQCPFSREAQPAITQVLDAYPEHVRLTLVFFPLPQHNNGQLAAQAGLCAHEQGKFWSLHDAIFLRQHIINNSVGDKQALLNIRELASDSGIDLDTFDECIESGRTREKVRRDYESAVSLGLKGTPTFFINGKKLTGPQSFRSLKKGIGK